jgi:hypothetical protein
VVDSHQDRLEPEVAEQIVCQPRILMGAVETNRQFGLRRRGTLPYLFPLPWKSSMGIELPHFVVTQ